MTAANEQEIEPGVNGCHNVCIIGERHDRRTRWYLGEFSYIDAEHESEGYLVREFRREGRIRSSNVIPA